MEKVPILPVLLHYGGDDLPEAIRWRPCKCPFHDDRNASASYIAHEERQGFNCHGCGIKGDALAVVQQVESCDFRDAVKRCEEIVGLDLSGSKDTAPKKYKAVRIGQTDTEAAPAATRRKKKLRLREV